MSYTPAPYDFAEDRRRAAAMRSYVTPALITLALYFLFWFPGLIANVIYGVAALGDQQASGQVPQGRGCLIALFAWFVILPLLLVCAFIGYGFVAGA